MRLFKLIGSRASDLQKDQIPTFFVQILHADAYWYNQTIQIDGPHTNSKASVVCSSLSQCAGGIFNLEQKFQSQTYPF